MKIRRKNEKAKSVPLRYMLSLGYKLLREVVLDERL